MVRGECNLVMEVKAFDAIGWGDVQVGADFKIFDYKNRSLLGF